MPQDIPETCDGCGKKFLIEHAPSCPKGALVLARHDETAKEWGALGSRALVPIAITYKPRINSRIVKGERTGAKAQQKGGASDGGVNTVGEAQGSNGRTVNGAVILVEQLGQLQVPADSREDVSIHGLWKQGNTAMFDMRIVNLNASSYVQMTPEKALAKVDKEKKDLYLQACLEHRRTFTPIVYSADILPGAEDLAAQKRLDALLSYKLKREYSEMCGFVRVRMSLAIVRSNSPLLCGPRNKGEHI